MILGNVAYMMISEMSLDFCLVRERRSWAATKYTFPPPSVIVQLVLEPVCPDRERDGTAVLESADVWLQIREDVLPENS